MSDNEHKPLIESIINTAAITMTGFAIVTLTTKGEHALEWIKALFLLFSGVGLEYFKYFGRMKKLW